jgi:hypothetical protein
VSYAEATPREDITALPAGEHTWVVSIRGDVPVFPSGYPTVDAPSAFSAKALAEMLPVMRAAEIGRDRILLTRLDRT